MKDDTAPADPWRFQRWAFATRTGSMASTAVLQALAMMADKETGRCEAKQSTLAFGLEVSERTTRHHLKKLVEAGLIARRPQFRNDGARRGDEYILLAPGVTEWPDGSHLPPADSSGGSDTPLGVSEDTPPRVRSASGQEPSTTKNGLSEKVPGSPDGSEGRKGVAVDPPESTAPQANGRPEIDRLCRLHADLCNERTESARYKPTGEWLRHMRLLIDADGRSVAEVEAAIRWVHADDFWGANILSVPKLRKRYDRIRLEARRNGTGRREPERDRRAREKRERSEARAERARAYMESEGAHQ